MGGQGSAGLSQLLAPPTLAVIPSEAEGSGNGKADKGPGSQISPLGRAVPSVEMTMGRQGSAGLSQPLAPPTLVVIPSEAEGSGNGKAPSLYF